MNDAQQKPKDAKKSDKKELSPAEKAAKLAKRNDEARARFLKYAPKRTRNALKALKNVAACGNLTSYRYSPEEAGKIMEALASGMSKVAAAFTAEQAAEQEFTL